MVPKIKKVQILQKELTIVMISTEIHLMLHITVRYAQ